METNRKPVGSLAHMLNFVNPDSLFPTIPAPPLFAVSRGDWEVKANRLPKFIRGYFIPNRRAVNRDNWVLRKKSTQEVWMSTAPMERESQSHHVFAARDTVLVGGLGLGAVLWALLRKETVKRVVVVERDPVVIDIARASW